MTPIDVTCNFSLQCSGSNLSQILFCSILRWQFDSEVLYVGEVKNYCVLVIAYQCYECLFIGVFRYT